MRASRGDDLQASVAVLSATRLTDLCIAELQSLIVVLSPAVSRLAGLQAAVLGELAGRGGGAVPSSPGPDGVPGPDVMLRHWLSDVTRAGASAAGRDVRHAGLLVRLPRVMAAVLDGRLPLARALVLTSLLDKVADDRLADAEPALIDVAVRRDPESLRHYVAHLIATWCEPEMEAEESEQESRRYLVTRRESDGMLYGRFRLGRADSESFLSLIEPLARRAGLDDNRTSGQRRADALVETCGLALGLAELPVAGGFRPQVSYVVPAGWAAGQGPGCTFAELVQASLARTERVHDAPGAPDVVTSSRVPQDLCATGAWSGPQTRTRIETVLCDARITRVLLGPDGQVRSLTTLADTVTKAQRLALAARDHGCVARGCHRPPAFCDAHHLVHLADGGATCLDNLVLLCRRHHVLWHQGRLQLHHLHVPWLAGGAPGAAGVAKGPRSRADQAGGGGGGGGSGGS